MFFTLTLIWSNSFAKVGDRFACSLKDSKSIYRDSFVNEDADIEVVANKDTSKAIYLNILENDKVKIEHKYGSQSYQLKQNQRDFYIGLDNGDAAEFRHIILKKKLNDEWLFRFLTVKSVYEFDISYSSFNCILLK